MQNNSDSTARFTLGQIVATAGVSALVEAKKIPLLEYLQRHQSGDWGDLEDQQDNEDALVCGGQLLSVYMLETGIEIWIITEADRSVTTILLPDEY